MDIFKPITLKDKEQITSYVFPSDNQDCDLAFANLCSWQFISESSYAVVRDRLVIRFAHPEWGHEYFMPFGEGDPMEVVRELDECARAVGERLCLRDVTPEFRGRLEADYPGRFVFTEDRDYSDYIYNRSDLAELKGNHYQPKRNHVNKFSKTYHADYGELMPDLFSECLDFEATWCSRHGYEENGNILNERRSLGFVFRHWEELGCEGAVIRIDGKIVAFTLGSPINHNTFGVHYEKADIATEGAYSAINHYFASRLPDQYLYVNREEDLGIPGLRQAKLSYHPTLLLSKMRAVK